MRITCPCDRCRNERRAWLEEIQRFAEPADVGRPQWGVDYNVARERHLRRAALMDEAERECALNGHNSLKRLNALNREKLPAPGCPCYQCENERRAWLEEIQRFAEPAAGYAQAKERAARPQGAPDGEGPSAAGAATPTGQRIIDLEQQQRYLKEQVKTLLDENARLKDTLAQRLG